MALATPPDPQPSAPQATPSEPSLRRGRRRSQTRARLRAYAPQTQGNTGVTGIATLTFTAGEAAAHLADWQALADRALEPNPFYRPDFLLPYLRHMERADVTLCAVRRDTDGAFLALAPFARRRLGLLLSGATAHAGDYGPLGTPLVAPDADADVLAALIDTAHTMVGTDIVTLPYLRTDGPVYDLVLDLEEANLWRLDLDNPCVRAGHATGPTGEEQYRALGTRRRKEVERQFRRLSDTGAVDLVSLDKPEAVAAAFEAFLTLEARGWKGRRGTALACRNDRASFARAFIARMAEAGRVRIDVLRRDAAPIAMMIMLRDGARMLSWKIAYDEDLARFSPGAQVSRYSMRRTLETDGVAEADSLAVPDHPMITPLWRGRIPYATAILTRGPAADLRLSLTALDHALERRLRRAAKRVVTALRGGDG